MFRNLIVFSVLFFLSIYFFLQSGTLPTSEYLSFETGMTFALGALFLLVDRILSENPNKELLSKIETLQHQINKIEELLED